MDNFLTACLKIDPCHLSDYKEYFSALEFDFSSYKCGRHVLFKDGEREIVLRVWDQTPTSYHSHPKGGCMFKVLQGCIAEERSGKHYVHMENETVFTRDSHRVYPSQNCVTLHYYSQVSS